MAPSLPGYGWSDKPAKHGWKTDRIARAWDELMRRLGYDRYGAQGGDWGSAVTTNLGQQAPDGLVGIHLNMAIALPDPETMSDLTPKEQQALDDVGVHTKTGHRLLHPAVDPPADGRLRRSTTRPPASARGSPRSSGRGPTATATPRTR